MMVDEMPKKEGDASPEMAEMRKRVEDLEAKVCEMEKAIWDLIGNLQKNLEILGSVNETFQNLNSYLIVNVGPPLFIE
jgi:hypothetical protein